MRAALDIVLIFWYNGTMSYGLGVTPFKISLADDPLSPYTCAFFFVSIRREPPLRLKSNKTPLLQLALTKSLELTDTASSTPASFGHSCTVTSVPNYV